MLVPKASQSTERLVKNVKIPGFTAAINMFTGYKNCIVFNSPFLIVLRPEAVKAKGVIA